MKREVFYRELEERLRVMTREQRIYRILKEGLQREGYWKNKARGNNMGRRGKE